MSYLLNVSEEHKYFLWSPAKTGSTSFTNIFENFSFYKWEFDDDGFLLYKTNKIMHNHYCRFFHGHEDYGLIISARNPYSMIYSILRLDLIDKKTALGKLEKHSGLDKIERHVFHKNKIFKDCCYCCFDDKPKHYIRLENLFEDYSKLDFIRNSELYKSGKLYDECKIKYNASGTQTDEWKKFYDKDSADLVYYNHANYFESVGYHKDSWME